MNLVHLLTLISIVEEGSLSAAARARQISQPAVTKQLQRVEAELGLKLLVRGQKRQVELTPAGEKVLAFARDTLSRYQVLEEELASLKKVSDGTLVLAASTTPGVYVLPGLLASFRSRYPRVQVRMTISDTATVVDQLLARSAHVGMIGSIIRRPGLRLERLISDKVVLAVPPDHPFAQKEWILPQDLLGEALVLREEGSGTRRSVEAALAASGQSLPLDDVVLELGSTQAILQAVEQGLGLGFVSFRAAAPEMQAGRLACVKLEGVDLSRNLYLAYRPERIGDGLIARFLGFARRELDPESKVT